MAGMPAEANSQAIRSFRAWCLADLPGARLQAKLWRPCASTSEGEPIFHVQQSMPGPCCIQFTAYIIL